MSDDASEAYRKLVAEAVASEERKSAYRPASPRDLTVTRRRAPRTVTELDETERTQLGAILGDELASHLADLESEVEVADVVDAAGALVYKLYGWNYGAGILFRAGALDVVGFATQHHVEHWRPEQRELFFAMDHALRKPGHGLRQPLSFCWWLEECWEAIADAAPGTVGSEPWVLTQLGKKKPS